MKKSLHFMAFLLGACQLSSIAQDTIYLNANFQETTADKAAYFRKKMKTDTGWLVTDFYRSGKIQMTGTFADDSFKIAQGEVTWYDDKGILNRRCNFVKGKAEGNDAYYYTNGHKKVTGTNKGGEQDGEWLAYYPSGQLAGKASYDKGKQVSAAFFNEDGSKNKNVKEFMKDASYPGGPAQFLRYLNKILKYPETALKNKIQGTVVILFKITKDGNLADIKVAQSVEKSLDNEALRVIREATGWEPALMGGIPFDSYRRQPIVFRL